LTNQTTREEAVEMLTKTAIPEDEVRAEFEYVAKKLGISMEELKSYMDAPNKSYKDYRNREWMFNVGAKLLNMVGIERAIKR
jgi:hypothetical protein